MSFTKATAIVIYAPMGDVDTSAPVHPAARYSEILDCKNGNAKAEKYLVWRLLEHAVKNYTNLDFANLQFTKTDTGKWMCPELHFSLSHTDGLVCVAISDEPIGVDAEAVRSVRHELASRILTDKERMLFECEPESGRGEHLLKSWVTKESIFKRGGGTALLPNRIEAAEHPTALRHVTVGTCEYLISVCHTDAHKIEFNYVEEI